MDKKFRSLLLYIAIPLLIILSIYAIVGTSQQTVKTEYYQIVDLFNENKVESFTLNWGNGDLTYTLRADKADNQGRKKAYTYTAPSASVLYEDIHDIIVKTNREATNDSQKIKYDYERGNEGSWLLNFLPTFLMIALTAVLFIFMMRKMNRTMGDGGTMGFGKMKIRQTGQDKRKTTFADVAGADEEKAELEELVEFLKDHKKFDSMGARIPKGVLLVGPPGTGKTLLARAVAGEAGVPFFSISGSDFVEMFVGVGASRVRDLFEQAKKNAPSIIFIDEIDAVGRQRGAGLGGGHDEREQTLNQLLVEMDGFGANEGVIIIAATNRPDILDKALLRPGRFDRQVTVNYPDVKGREEILKVHAKGKPLGPDVNLKTIAKSTSGFTGADLENLLNEAALLAVRNGLKAIVEENIEEATLKVVMGTEKRSHKMNDKDKRITSYHEAGHAIVSYFLPTQDPVHQISIIPRGMAAGFTMYLPTEDQGHVSKTSLLESICSLLGGRAAEKLTQDDICTGASNDIERATEIARKMITKYGMSEKLGPVMFGNDQSEVFLGRDIGSSQNYSERIAAVIDDEIDSIIKTQYNKAINLLETNMDKVVSVAEYLFKYEKMDNKVFTRIMQGEDVKILEAEAENDIDKIEMNESGSAPLRVNEGEDVVNPSEKKEN